MVGHRWSGPRSIPLSKIDGSHSVERGRHTPKRFLNDPIYVVPRGWIFTRYRVHDGNRRVRDARARGDRTIRAYVRED